MITYPMTEEQKKLGYSVMYFERISKFHQCHAHTSYELVFVSDGAGIHIVNGAPQRVSAGSLILIRPGDVHVFQLDGSERLCVYVLKFGYGALRRACEMLLCEEINLTSPGVVPSADLTGESLAEADSFLSRLAARGAEDGRRLFYSHLPLMLDFLAGEAESVAATPRWLRDLLRSMDDRANIAEGLPRMLELSALSQEHFTREFKRYTRITPTQYVNIKRCEYAAELLLTTELSLADVCFTCGFGNISYFHRVFKRRYGCSPGSFIRMNVQPA